LVIVFGGITFLAIASTMSQSLSSSLSSEVMTMAADLANEKMERVFADKQTLGYAFIVSSNYPDETNPAGHNGFTRTLTVTTFSTYKRVEVRVMHPDIADCVLSAFMTNY